MRWNHQCELEDQLQRISHGQLTVIWNCRSPVKWGVLRSQTLPIAHLGCYTLKQTCSQVFVTSPSQVFFCDFSRFLYLKGNLLYWSFTFNSCNKICHYEIQIKNCCFLWNVLQYFLWMIYSHIIIFKKLCTHDL